MHLQVLVGLGLALMCALGTNLGGLWKHKGATQTDDVDVRRPVSTAVALFRSKWWTIGWLVAAVGWLLHIGALALAPLSLAQAVISGGLVLLGLLAERWFGFKLHKRQWIGLVLVSLGMAALAATARSEGNHSGYATIAMATFEGASLALGAALAIGCRIERLRERHGILLGAAAGLLFGVADVSIKAATGGSSSLLTPWTGIAVIAAIAAFYASARSLQIGDGVAVITATAATANVLGILAGVVVFGDPLGKDTVTIAGRVAAFLLVVGAVALIPGAARAQDALGEDGDTGEKRSARGEHDGGRRRRAGRVPEPAVAPTKGAA